MTLILNSIYYIDIISFECHSQDAFSLLAYSNPWSSPMGWQLCPSRREIVCAALNSAILGKLENKKKSEISRSSCQ